MINLKTTSQIFKKIAVGFGILSMLIVLAFAIWLRFKNPELPPKTISLPSIQQNPRQKPPTSIKFGDSLKAEFPENVPLFKLEKYSITKESAKATAVGFGISKEPDVITENTLDGTQYNWQDGDLDLALSQSQLLFRSINSAFKTPLSEEKLKEITLNFIANAPLIDKDLSLNTQKTKYLKVPDKGLPTNVGSFNEADAIEFAFDKNLNNLPILTNSPLTPYTTIRVSKGGTITLLESRFFNRYSQQEQYPIKRAKNAQEEVLKGQGKVVQTYSPDEFGQALELFRQGPFDIKSLQVEKVYLAYFLPEVFEEVIQPIFVFEGETQKDDKKIKAIIYLPAIENPTQP